MAWCSLGNERLRLWLAEPGEPASHEAALAPGTLLEPDKEALRIVCGDGVLRVTRAQLPVVSLWTSPSSCGPGRTALPSVHDSEHLMGRHPHEPAAPQRRSQQVPRQWPGRARRRRPGDRAGDHRQEVAERSRRAPVVARDRGLFKELCFGTCRTLPRLEALAGKLLEKPFKTRDADIQALLLVGIYQLLYLRVPAHAAVGETAGAARLLSKAWATRVLNGCLRRLQRESAALQAEVDRDPAVALLHPRWWVKTLRQAWPDDWRSICEANNQPGPMTLRVNRRYGDREMYLERLDSPGARLCPHAPDGLTLEAPCDVAELPGFREGHVSIQDEAAQLAAVLLGPVIAPRPGARVLDACCAPGGKAAHLLELFDIDLQAIDSDDVRLARVEDTLARLG